jgi:hypothetical protein
MMADWVENGQPLCIYRATFYVPRLGGCHKNLSVAPVMETGITDHARSLKETAAIAN